jgi:hypothetical protein
VQGAKVYGTGALAIDGVYIEPPEMVPGRESLAHFVRSTAGKDRCPGPNDVDNTLYSPKKRAGLACKANPTALHFLFAGDAIRTAIGTEVVRNRQVFLARSFRNRSWDSPTTN